MFRTFVRTAVLGAILVSSMASSSPASATSWSTNFSSGPSFSATAPGSKFKITATGGKVSGLICSTSTATGALTAATNPGPSWMGVSTFTPAFSSCTGLGVWVMTCGAASLNALSFVSGVTTGSVTGFSCRMTSPGAGCGTNPSTGITIIGSLSGGNYNNATSQLTIPTTGQSLVSVWSAGGCTTLLGTSPGATIWGRTPTPSSSDPETLVATATSAFKPSIVQP